MKLDKIKIKNFRSYKDETEVDFGNFTAFVGKNDIGKSTVLEAMDIFFNEGKGIIKIDKDDVNKQALSEGDTETIITAIFSELPDKIIIDATSETTLKQEFILNADNRLEVIKKYSNGGKEKVFIKAMHPIKKECNNLLEKKNSDLKKIIIDKGLEEDCDQTVNATMRASIWKHYKAEEELAEIELDVTKGETKSIWEKLQNYLPLYSLFQSDRKNSDGDNEVQDPLKEAVKQILNDPELKTKFSQIADEVRIKLQDVSTRTLQKVQEMNPDVATTLNPIIPTTESLKWADVFKNVSIAGDENIPINKRGSGVKRLILLNFFRAEAERRKAEKNIPSVIYAIEEPETSQHTQHQKMLVKAFLELSNSDNSQVIITTHSATLVKELDFEHLKLIKTEGDTKKIEAILPHSLPYPSLNEVNFIAFTETTEEYHNELYGYLEMEGKLSEYKIDKVLMPYIRSDRNGNTKNEQKPLTEYVRHQIHHPENELNTRYTAEQLAESISMMREFITTEMN